MRTFLRIFFVLIPLLLSKYCISQPGTLDSSFGINGIAPSMIVGYEAQATGIIIHPDGRIIVSGYSGTDGRQFELRRYSQNGFLDSSFGINGKVLTSFDGKYHIAYCAALDSTNRIIVAGTQSVDGFNQDFELVRFNANGIIDSSFGTNGMVVTDFSTGPNKASDLIKAVLIQKDKKIVCIGTSMNGQNGVTSFALARYKSNGLVDSAFGTFGKVITSFVFNGTSEPFGAAIQKDGRIVAAGYVRNGISNNDFAISRYTLNGTLDSTFGNNGKVTTDFGSNQDFARAIAIQSDSKIVVIGQAQLSNTDYSSNIALARYSQSGQLDSSFGVNGKVQTYNGTYSEGFAIQIQPDKKLVIGTRTTGMNGPFTKWGLMRYKNDGVLDSTFGLNGKTETNWGYDGSINSMVLLNDGKLIATGYAYGFSGYYDFPVGRYNIYEPVMVKLKNNISINEGSVGITSPALFKVVLNKSSPVDVLVNYTTRNLNALAGSDYAATSGTLRIKAGKATGNIIVSVIGDNTREANERFALVLSNPVNAVLGTLDSAVCVIKNDDPSFAFTNSTTQENFSIENKSVKIFPNPVNDVLNIQGLSTQYKIQISILDVNGHVLAAKDISTSSYLWNIKSLPAGAYYLHIEEGIKQTTLKFVKQ